MSAVPVISVNPSDPAWLQAAINAINAEIKAGNVPLLTLLAQIFALGERIASSL